MTTRPLHCLPVLLLGMFAGMPSPAAAETLVVPLRSFEEVPSISSTAQGRFRARIDEAAGTIAYELSYDGLQGTVRQAHIHVGQRGVNGGISTYLCQTATNPDPTNLAPTCPASGSVSGLLQATNVIGPGAQGLSAGEFAELVKAVRGGVAYINVHSSLFPGGEIRGQTRSRHDED